VAVAVRRAAAALGPADDREPAKPEAVKPRPHPAGGEVDIGLRDAARPVILRPVEAGRPKPVRQRELAAVLDAEPTLLRRVDHEEAAEAPDRRPARRLLAFLIEDRHARAGISELAGRDQAGEAAADDEGIDGFGHVAKLSRRTATANTATRVSRRDRR